MKKVLVLCTGNSCRSILAEGLINQQLEGIKAYSAGSNPSGRVNPNAKKVLEEIGAWDEHYHSKTIEEAEKEAGGHFDLVVTVCDNAKQSCPIFPGDTKTIHVGFEDPDGKPYEAFVATKNEIEQRLLPRVKEELGL